MPWFLVYLRLMITIIALIRMLINSKGIMVNLLNDFSCLRGKEIKIKFETHVNTIPVHMEINI